MSESKFLSQQIETTINREQKATAVKQTEEQRQKRDRIRESKTIEKKWSTKKAPHFAGAKEEGYNTRNATRGGKKGGLHPTWRSSR